MDLRLLELIATPETAKKARDLVDDDDTLGVWSDKLDEQRSVVRFLLDANLTESITDKLTDQFDEEKEFRIMLFTVEATMPQPEEEEEEKKEQDDEATNRISREELYTDISNSSRLDWVYIAMIGLSTLVAGVGLILDDVATIIGAMVIAPLLAPNVSLALASTLGDIELGWQSLKANAAGLGTALIVAFLMGLILHVDTGSSQLTGRTMVNLKQIIIALAAGSAGVLAFTRGVSATIVGVMVAVALLPPLVDVGLLLGAGYYQLAVGAGILTITNLICINLAGIITLFLQGVRPRNWRKEKKAQKATRIAIAIWMVLLIAFAIIIWYWGQFDIKSMIK